MSIDYDDKEIIAKKYNNCFHAEVKITHKEGNIDTIDMFFTDEDHVSKWITFYNKKFKKDLGSYAELINLNQIKDRYKIIMEIHTWDITEQDPIRLGFKFLTVKSNCKNLMTGFWDNRRK